MVNEVTLIGNLGKDAELITFNNGSKKVGFGLATTKSYKDKDGEWVNDTTWHNVSIYGTYAENYQGLSKGERVRVKGSISNRDYEKDGVKRFYSEVVAISIKRLDKKEVTGDEIPL